MIYDCFVSYKSEDIKFVTNLVDELEKRGLSCWFAPRNVQNRYAKSIADAIKTSKVFLLILNKKSAVSEDVLNEVEMAHNVSKATAFAKIQPVYTVTLDLNDSEIQEMMYYIRRLHFADVRDIDDYGQMAEIIIKSQPQLQQKAAERKDSHYKVQEIELERLKGQNELLKSFDADIYNDVFDRYVNSNVLDVGCSSGNMLVPFAQEKHVEKFMGIDISSEAIQRALEQYKIENYNFYVNDVTDPDFAAQLSAQMKFMGIERFDIINVSMVLLHLKEPMKVLETLKQFLSEDGTVIIRDIDDGLNFAYPDPERLFDRIYKICANDEQSGHRNNGRQIYHDLRRAGFSRIRLERQGLASIEMSAEQKDTFFHMYFPFILSNSQLMAEKYPWNVEYQDDYKWYKENYTHIHKQFMHQDFVFSLGFVSYSAQI